LPQRFTGGQRNERFDDAEILREHQAATIRRIAGESVVLAVQDTAP
jgi:hypothetical protein